MGFGNMIGAMIQEVGNMIRHDKDIANGWLTNAWSAKQNKKAWERNAWMAANAHQIEVNDLRAAGLNPVLSAGQGASAPASLAISPQMGRNSTSAPDFGAAISKDLTDLVRSEADAKKAATEKVRAETKKIEAEADKSKAESVPAKIINDFTEAAKPTYRAVRDAVKFHLKDSAETLWPRVFGNGGRNSAGSIQHEKIPFSKLKITPEKVHNPVAPETFYFDKKGMYKLQEGRKVYIYD